MFTGLCGMRLNTAGVVIGWIGAAMSLIAVIIIGMCLSRIDDIVNVIMDNMKDRQFDENTVRYVLTIVFIVYLTGCIINMMASALLIAGTIRERHLFLVPWLINSGLALLFSVLYYLYSIGSLIAASTPFGIILISLISTGLGLVFHWVIWYTIYSLFKQLQANREQQQLLGVAGTSYPAYSKI